MLNDPRLIAFITHGGANSLLESIYYGKCLIGFPQAVDQIGTAYRVEMMGVGLSVGNSPDYNDFINAINELAPKHEGHVTEYQKKMDKLRRLIHFRELRQGKDFAWNLRRVIKFGEFAGDK